MADTYTDEIGREICRRISTSTDSLKAICKAEDMPAVNTVRLWRLDHPDFNTMFIAARAAQQDNLIEQCMEIADEADVGDWQVAKQRIEQRRWQAGKFNPKTYGEKITHSGDADAPLVTNPSADALIAFLLAKGATEHEIRAFIAAPNVIEHNPTKDKV